MFKNREHKLRYSIRKLSVGICGVCIGCFLIGGGLQKVAADEIRTEISNGVSVSNVTATTIRDDSPQDNTNNEVVNSEIELPMDSIKHHEAIENNVESEISPSLSNPNETLISKSDEEIASNQEEGSIKDQSTVDNSSEYKELTADYARKISSGELYSEGENPYDNSLYGQESLDPEGDDDHDGIKNKDEIYIYSKNGKEYVGYHSHPKLEDSDGDGLLDNEDDNKKQWYITDRDMAMFMELSYRDDEYIHKVLDDTRPLIDVYKNRKEYVMMNNELAPFWELKKSYHTNSGLDAVLFQTKSNLSYLVDNTVQVLAIRGTRTLDNNDLWNDFVILGGNNPAQAEDIKNIIEELANDNTVNNLYITGHSLGGYLAQRAAVEAYQKHRNFFDNRLKKVTTFNSPKVVASRTIWNAKNGLWDVSLESKKLADMGKIVHYVVTNDAVVGGMLNTSDNLRFVGAAKVGHRSRGYFESRLNDVAYFNIGKRQTVDGIGYRDQQLDKVFFFNKIPNIMPRTSLDTRENIALGKKVTQSSTAYDGDANRAVDGNDDGDYGHHSVTHTNFEKNAWLELDLGKSETIEEIQLYNRTDSESQRLSNFDIILKDERGNIVSKQRIHHLLGNVLNLSGENRRARYIRVQLDAEHQALSLAEVKIYRAENIALRKNAIQSSIAYGGNASRAVDGDTRDNWESATITHTDFEEKPWWQVDLGKEENLGTVRIFNRGDGEVANRLSNFDVVLKDELEKEIDRYHVASLNGEPFVDVNIDNKQARYVRIELKNGRNALSLAEVEVYRTTHSQNGNVRTPSNQEQVVPVFRSKEAKEINTYLLGLDYDTEKILTRRGETIENRFEPTMSHQNDEFVVIEKIKHSLQNSNSDVSVHNSNIYLGALLKADSNLLENNPTLISISRNKIRLSVDLPGLSANENTILVEPSYSSVKNAIGKVVEDYYKKYGASHPIPAKMSYDSETAYSLEQIKAKFGADFEKIGAPLKIDFEAINKGEKQVEVVRFKQVYFTATMDAPENPGDVFGTNVTVEDLQQRGITNQTPPVYVSNISYGRQMYMKFETTSSTNQLKAAIDATIKGVKIAPGSEWERVLKATKVTVVILGGNAQEASNVVTGTVDDLKKLIQSGSIFSNQSPAVAISYRTAFLKDNQLATIQNNTDYVETRITSYKDGYLNLNHRGAYVARYYIYWDEVGRDLNGNETIRSRAWEGNGQGRTSGFSTSIQLKGNVRNLRIKIQEATGLIWEKWRTIYEKVNVPLVRNRTLTHWGTTLSPKLSEKIDNDSL